MEDTKEEEDLPVVMTYKIILPDDERINNTTIRSATVFVSFVFVHMFLPYHLLCTYVPYILCTSSTVTSGY